MAIKTEGQEIQIDIVKSETLRPPLYVLGRPVDVAFNGKLSKVIIIEDGTQNKHPLLMLMGLDHNQRAYCLNVTGATFHTIDGTLKGVEDRLKGIMPQTEFMKQDDRAMYIDFREINTTDLECLEIRGMDTNKVSDGYHTFGELYQNRITNYLVLCRQIANWQEQEGWSTGKKTEVWRSKKHSNGELAYGGEWFVLGINKEPGKQITYHLPISAWDKTEFAETLEQSPEFDGHTSEDVLNRLAEL